VPVEREDVLIATLTTWAAHTLDALGYPGLVVLMLASPPIPSEAILPLAGFFVGRGELAFSLALAAATLGAVGNALIVYGLARCGGRPLILRGRLLHIDEERLDRVERRFARHDLRVVALGRMMSVVRWLVGIPAGVGRMPLRRYVPLTTIGCMGWNSLLLSAGWVLGRNHAQAGHVVVIGSAVLLVVGTSVALGVALRRRRLRSNANAARCLGPGI
jgi:membrane protein DedA with SNARE-associated domain